jgi:archaellum component FlaC
MTIIDRVDNLLAINLRTNPTITISHELGDGIEEFMKDFERDIELIHLKAHLLSMDAKDELNELKHKLKRFNTVIKHATQSAHNGEQIIHIKIDSLINELKKGYRQLESKV